jgi:sugar phosphate isomerase/epimerase
MRDFSKGFTRREFAIGALMVVPASGLASRLLAERPASADASARQAKKIDGVEIGAITYSFRSMPNPVDIIAAMKAIGLTEAEVMSGDVEKLAGIPVVGRGDSRDPITAWRKAATPAMFAAVTKKFKDAGIEVRFLTYNMSGNTTDEEIEYAFNMASALGAKAITTSTQVSVAKRIAPFADKHKMRVGFHGHSNITNPDEFATPESFAAAMAMSPYHCVNLDIGHFTAANFDAVAYIKEHHARITNLHLKDRKKDQGANLPWGEGDTPIKAVLQLLKKEKWPIPANIEYEYKGADTTAEVAKCFEFCKAALK